jgi:hypothetical protein
MVLMVPPFGGGVASFEDDVDPQPLIDDPPMELGELRLDLGRLSFVLLLPHRSPLIPVPCKPFWNETPRALFALWGWFLGFFSRTGLPGPL